MLNNYRNYLLQSFFLLVSVHLPLIVLFPRVFYILFFSFIKMKMMMSVSYMSMMLLLMIMRHNYASIRFEAYSTVGTYRISPLFVAKAIFT